MSYSYPQTSLTGDSVPLPLPSSSDNSNSAEDNTGWRNVPFVPLQPGIPHSESVNYTSSQAENQPMENNSPQIEPSNEIFNPAYLGNNIQNSTYEETRNFPISNPLSSEESQDESSVAHNSNIQSHDPSNEVLTEKLPDLRLDKRRLISHFFLDMQTVQSLLCARGEGCLSSSANYASLSSKRRLLRFETTVHNDGEAPFYPAMKKEDWIWHECHKHSHSMAVFTYYDLLNENRTKVAEGHKASFCLEDSECRGGARKDFDCLKDHQGITPGCMDIYKASIDCQWIDVTDVVLGEYTLQVLINPQRLVPESNWNNNGIECKVLIKRFVADIWGCKEISV